MAMLNVSYIPLLYTPMPVIREVNQGELDKFLESTMEFIEGLRKEEIGQADACLWAWGIDDDTKVATCPKPTLILDRGNDVYKHMMWWSEGQPEKFFQFAIHYDAEKQWYSCAVMPDLCRSTARIKYSAGIITPNIEVDEKDVIAIFLPLSFNTNDPASLRRMLDGGVTLPTETIDVGILDAALFNIDQAREGDAPFDADDVNWLSAIPVVKADEYLEGFRDENSKPKPERKSRFWTCKDNSSVVDKILE